MEAVAPPAIPLQYGVVAGMMLTAAVAIFAPLIAAALFIRRTGAPGRVLMQGALVFFVSQVLLRLPWFIPLQHALSDTLKDPAAQLGFLAFAAVTAGLFEEVGRYVGYRYLLKEERSWRTGVLYGLGHGGLESIILVGLTVMGSVVTYILLARGGLELPPEQAEAVRTVYADMTPGTALMGGVERLGALALHVALSVMVLRAFQGQRRWLWISIAVHSAVNTVVPLLAREVSLYVAEAVMVAVGIAAIVFVRRARAIPAPQA